MAVSAGGLHQMMSRRRKGTLPAPQNNESFVFDPFNLGDSDDDADGSASSSNDALSSGFPPTASARQPQPEQTRQQVQEEQEPSSRTRRVPRSASNRIEPTGGSITALPPKMIVKLSVHEEVSSSSKRNSAGFSLVSVEGSVHVQVQCSDASRNAPFRLNFFNPQRLGWNQLNFNVNSAVAVPTTTSAGSVSSHSSSSGSTAGPGNISYIVTVPKPAIAKVEVGNYTCTEEKVYMPILVESKVNLSDKPRCRLGVQVRSNLGNEGDLSNFTVAVAVPDFIDGTTVKITRGNGTWDEIKRALKWTLDSLPRGETFMVCAEAELSHGTRAMNVGSGDELLPHFPVLVRCSSDRDQISSVKVDVTEAAGHPATITTTQIRSFRLLHRLK